MTIRQATRQMQPGESRNDYLKRAMRYCRQRYNKLRRQDRHHCSFSASDAMRQTEEMFVDLGTFGVEGLCFKDSFTSGLSYLNTGETYELTICFCSDKERFFLSSWGDFVESNPNLCL